MRMYLLEFILRKMWRVVLPTSAWLVAVLLPVALAQLGFLDFALIEGRCYHPLGRCGQDNVLLVAAGLGILLAVPAVAVSVIWGII